CASRHSREASDLVGGRSTLGQRPTLDSGINYARGALRHEELAARSGAIGVIAVNVDYKVGRAELVVEVNLADVCAASSQRNFNAVWYHPASHPVQVGGRWHGAA